MQEEHLPLCLYKKPEEQKMTKTYVKICPRCGSTDVTIPPAGLDIVMTMSDYCSACKNRGIFPEIEISQVPKFKATIEKK